MLILSRKVGQQIVLPTADVRITIVEISGHRVRVGIEAPAEVVVHRDEVWQKVLASKLSGRAASHDWRAEP